MLCVWGMYCTYLSCCKIIFSLSLVFVICRAQFCPNELEGQCPPQVIGNYRVFEVDQTGTPLLTNPILLNYTGFYFLFNNTAPGAGVTLATIIGCNITSNTTLKADNLVININVTIRSILRFEGPTRSRQVSNSPGLCTWPTDFNIPFSSSFYRMYVWNRVCPFDPGFEDNLNCPTWLDGTWQTSAVGNTTLSSFTISTEDGTRTTYDANGNIVEQDLIYCLPQSDGSLFLRTLLTVPISDFGTETRIYVVQTPTGITQTINPTGNCTWPNATTEFGLSYVLTVNPPSSTFPLNAVIGAVVGGGGGIIILIGAIIVVIILIRKKQIESQPKHLTPPDMSGENSEGDTTYRRLPGYASVKAGGYRVPQELLPYRNEGHGSIQISADRTWEIDFNELILEEEIGSGSFGVVWRGQWRNTEVAVKQMKGQMNEKQLLSFQQEAGLLQKLRPHNNVMLFLGVCTQPYPCIVTELLSGGSLFDLAQREELPYDKIIKLAMDICSGMAHLHSEQIIHRDLATRNVLLTETGVAKIADFGMSRVLESASGGAQTLSNIGPVKWMSPEALNERQYSVHSDVWSFGVTIWEIFARQEPFADFDATQAAIRIARDNLTLERPENCPDEMWYVTISCWNPVREERPSFASLFKQISNLARERGTASVRYVQY